MTAFFALSCFLTTFVPASAVFLKLVATDPLRVIMFVLGAFFWLCAVLFSALSWILAAYSLPMAMVFSVVFQEVARSLYYFLLHKAQGGLAKLAANGVGVTGIRLLHSSRHLLAIVCGLGMGVMAALFLILNIIADSWNDGVIGLPAVIFEKVDHTSLKFRLEDASFPIFYAISCSFLVFHHICWTIALWDGLHKRINRLTPMWWPQIIVAVLSHFLNTLLSYWLSAHSFLVIALQLLLLVGNLTFCFALIKNCILASPSVSSGADSSSL